MTFSGNPKASLASYDRALNSMPERDPFVGAAEDGGGPCLGRGGATGVAIGMLIPLFDPAKDGGGGGCT